MKAQTLAALAGVALLTFVLYSLYDAVAAVNREAKNSWNEVRRSLQGLINVQAQRMAKNCSRGYLPEVAHLDNMPDADLHTVYRDFGSNSEVLCKRMLRMGRVGDGGWEVCDDNHVRPRSNCLVYSFGINNDFSFDDHIAQHYGCEVHSFDPSMKRKDHKRSEKVMFHHLGVYGTNGVINNNWPVKTFSEIKKMLGHTERHIDVLKMDIEDSEWPTLETAFKDGSFKNISQLLMEIHNFKDTRASTLSNLKILKAMRDHGFRIFYSHKNHDTLVGSRADIPLRTCCHEIHMIYVPACDKFK